MQEPAARSHHFAVEGGTPLADIHMSRAPLRVRAGAGGDAAPRCFAVEATYVDEPIRICVVCAEPGFVASVAIAELPGLPNT